MRARLLWVGVWVVWIAGLPGGLPAAEPELDLRLKHFEADLVGWEEKAEVVTFPFVRVSPTEAVFEGLVFRRLEDDRLQAVVRTRSEDGEEGELELVYERVGNS